MKVPFKVSNSRRSCIAIEIAEAIYHSLASPKAVEALSLLREKKWEELINLSIDPSCYDDWRTFFSDYIASELMSKFPNFDVKISRSAVALDKFVESELTCRDSNFRIPSLYSARKQPTGGISEVFYSARSKIERLLGPFSWDEGFAGFGFGPGSNVSIPRRHGDAWYKIGCLKPTSTQGNLDLAVALVSAIPGWKTHLLKDSEGDIRDCFTIVPGNEVITVPKNAKTDRVIAKEPLMNIIIQKGIGSMIRHRLKRVGINLDSQERNQELARKGSLDGSLATVDLSSASDSISLELVRFLLPSEWVSAIELCRSPRGVLPDGRLVTYQKVSSMGNGYTFELQSLIFWALTTSVCQLRKEEARDVAVYGDDIILPVSCVELLSDVLAFSGFKFNPKKSFSAGPFRESCGKHYFHGHEVTPLYIRKDVKDVERDIWLANSIRRLAYRMIGFEYGCDSRLLLPYTRVLARIPRRFSRPSIPDGFGDGAIIGDLDEVTPKRHKHYDGWNVSYLRRCYSHFLGSGVPMLIKSLWSLEKRRGDLRTDDEVDLCRIPLQRFKLRRVSGVTRQWRTLGPWLTLNG